MESLTLMKQLIEIEKVIGIADVTTVRKLVIDAQAQVIKLYRYQIEDYELRASLLS